MDQRKRFFVVLGVLALIALASLIWQLTPQPRVADQTPRFPGSFAAFRDIGNRMEVVLPLVKRGDTKRALPLLRKLEEDSHRIPGMIGTIGDLYRQIGQVDRAYALLSSALSGSPRDSMTLVRIGYLELSLGERERALTRFQKAQSIAPGDPAPYQAEALYRDQEGKLPLAEVLLKKALLAAPDRWPTALLLADNQGKQGRYEEALRAIHALHQKHPTEATILAQQAHTLLDAARAQPFRAKSFRQKATRALEDAIKLVPEDASLFFDLGRAWHSLGEGAKAKKAWEESYRLKPSDPQRASQLGKLLVRQGEPERGRRLLAEAAAAESAQARFNQEVRKVLLAWKDGRARRRFAQWCGANQQTSRAILEWERLLRDYPGDIAAVREIERLKKSEIE